MNKEAQDLILQCSKDPSILQYRNYICLEPIEFFFRQITYKALKKFGSDMDTFKMGLLEVFKEFIEIIGNSTSRIVANSKDLFKPNTAILTYSYSKAVVASIINANNRHKDLIVYICETSPFKEGHQSYNQLTKAGVQCKLIYDNEIGNYINRVDIILIGAQVVLEDGSIINRIGTYTLALCASIRKKKVYVLAQTYKFLRRFILREADLPQVKTVVDEKQHAMESETIDLTPSEHISLVCSDLGIFTTAQISDSLIKLFQ